MENKKVVITSLSVVFIALLVVAVSVFMALRNNSNGEIEVKFDSSNSSGMQTVKIKKNMKIEKPEDPVREGYTFIGWFNGDEEWDFDKVVSEPITLVAKWEKNEEAVENLTVTFKNENGDTIQTQSVKNGTSITKPSDPVREGYTFIGWFNGNEKWDFSKTINSNITLTAKFTKDEEAKTYKVTFDSNGGSSVKSQNVKEGSKAVKPSNPTKSGYVFAGWLLNGKSYNFNTPVTKDITLVASWNVSPKKYTVTFNSNGGSSVPSQTVEENKTAVKPANPTRSGYKFLGWTYNGQDFNFSTKITGNITLVAKWEEVVVYEIQAVLIDPNDPYTPEMKVIVYRNGAEIQASELYGDNKLIGKYVSAINGIRVNKSEFNQSSTFKVKLTNNTIVDAVKR